MKADPDALALYSSNCLKCSYLVEGATKKFSKCHFSRGNELCPASEIRIVITGKTSLYLQRLKKARAKKDAKAEAEVWAAISKESPAFQARMYEVISGKL